MDNSPSDINIKSHQKLRRALFVMNYPGPWVQFSCPTPILKLFMKYNLNSSIMFVCVCVCGGGGGGRVINVLR